jgi:hypothetical protein
MEIVMKRIFGILAASIAFTACGVDGESTSDLQAKGRDASESFFAPDVEVKPVNAGINPQAFAWELTGRIMTGSNPCQANGVEAFVREIQDGDRLLVVPMIARPASYENRICTREFNPQYAKVTKVIRGFMNVTSDVIVKNVGAVGQDRSIHDLISLQADSVISDLKVDQVQGGIGAESFVYTVSGSVLVASNPCFARGVTPTLQVEKAGDRIVVTPVTRSTLEASQRICPMIYMPVYANVSVEVSGLLSEFTVMEVRNVGEMERSELIPL